MRRIEREGGLSGYEYTFDGQFLGRVGFSPLQYGGFVIFKKASNVELWELFDEDGELKSVDQALYLALLYLDVFVMEPSCPILSHLYHFLAYEYERAKTGSANAAQISIIEQFLRQLEWTDKKRLSVSLRSQDGAALLLVKAVYDAERDSVLVWEERQRIFAALFERRKTLIETKRRAHSLSWWGLWPRIHFDDWISFWKRFALRPLDNLKGISYRYTIGVLIWFFKTVKNNLGYSIALAIYGPFTFYFITQPLNPHAMWAVGHVRSAYLETTQKIANGDVLRSSQASVTDSSVAPAWVERMSSFKNMQIGLEENLIFAARMGRLEQMETQLSFPLIVENAWQTLGRYQDLLVTIKNSGGSESLSPVIKKYLIDEAERTQHLKVYIWDRFLRFLQDHPYIVLDQSHEQVNRDYYAGRAFILFREMTKELSAQLNAITQTDEIAVIEKLASHFEKDRKQASTVLASLTQNSALFRQKNRFDGQELRTTLKRQWEILYLLQNKAQEAANFGLMTYTWSVRNAIWILQSYYSTQERELRLLFLSPQKTSQEIRTEISGSTGPLLESLFHLLNLEYVSIQPELTERLGGDKETTQRRQVIGWIEKSLEQREAVLKSVNP